jgi:hypothetical protein
MQDLFFLLLELRTAIRALLDLVTHLRITVRTGRHVLIRLHDQTALRTLGDTFRNGMRARRANTLELLLLVLE